MPGRPDHFHVFEQSLRYKAGAHGTAGTVLAVPLFEQRGGRGTLSKLRGASNVTNDLAFATQLRIRCRRGRAVRRDPERQWWVCLIMRF